MWQSVEATISTAVPADGSTPTQIVQSSEPSGWWPTLLDGIVGALVGTIIGAVIGGLIAVYVARKTINSDRELQAEDYRRELAGNLAAVLARLGQNVTAHDRRGARLTTVELLGAASLINITYEQSYPNFAGYVWAATSLLAQTGSTRKSMRGVEGALRSRTIGHLQAVVAFFARTPGYGEHIAITEIETRGEMWRVIQHLQRISPPREEAMPIPDVPGLAAAIHDDSPPVTGDARSNQTDEQTRMKTD